jgi:3-oxoacyl-[acyl-carrier-protein] synthase-1
MQALLSCLDECKRQTVDVQKILDLGQLGIIFASTKGCIEDFVWQPGLAERLTDTLQPVLQSFLVASGIKPKLQICVSNACSSVHGAVYLAQSWMKSQRVRHVLIIAADSIGPFVVNGFSALKTFAETRVTPFAKDRQGIQIGDAATAIMLSNDYQGAAKILAADIESDGFAGRTGSYRPPGSAARGTGRGPEG